ncbi:hypothetical protein GCM10023094_17390 [Rhodococcus olei]|uniref:Uncharacterized protein n=1 Tax=Rhodococcus olei TaxID=2161675 RepID=A0ABP8P0J0_9NOCA
MTGSDGGARRRVTVLALTAIGSAILTAAPAAAQGSATGSAGSSGVVDAHFETLCTPTEPGLAELSGLAVDGTRMFAIGDSGTDRTLWVLGADCEVAGSLPVPGTPVDVEDLARSGGRLWLADTGDNNRVRTSVALTEMDPATGAGTSRVLTYPDGAHDAEALLIGRDGRPVVVTKELLADSGIYTTAGGETVADLSGPGPTALRRVGRIRLGPTDTPGGPLPVPGAASTLVTGGAVSADGRVVALRTYTDIYLYPAPDGDIVAALTGATPIRVPMPGQPQGEAVAFTPSGDLLSASEAADGPLPAILVLRGATGLVPLPPAEPEPRAASAGGAPNTVAAIAAGAGVGAALVGGALVVRSRRGDA